MMQIGRAMNGEWHGGNNNRTVLLVPEDDAGRTAMNPALK
jgi:hypothetical protein